MVWFHEAQKTASSDMSWLNVIKVSGYYFNQTFDVGRLGQRQKHIIYDVFWKSTSIRQFILYLCILQTVCGSLECLCKYATSSSCWRHKYFPLPFKTLQVRFTKPLTIIFEEKWVSKKNADEFSRCYVKFKNSKSLTLIFIYYSKSSKSFSSSAEKIWLREVLFFF